MHMLPPVPQLLGDVPLSHTPDTQQPAQVAGVHDVEHAPQSPGQVEQSSPPSQAPFPHEGAHPPQSATHDAHDSPVDVLQVPSPHPAHDPQSTAQDVQDSPVPGEHEPSPHIAGPAFEHPASATQATSGSVRMERRISFSFEVRRP